MVKTYPMPDVGATGQQTALKVFPKWGWVAIGIAIAVVVLIIVVAAAASTATVSSTSTKTDVDTLEDPQEEEGGEDDNAGATRGTLFDNTRSFVEPVHTDPGSVELGLRVTPLVDGQVTAIRFYRGVADPAGYTVSLWSADGTRLSSATTSTTDTGWIEVAITPVSVTASTSYVASYYAANGQYAVTRYIFENDAVSNAYLSAPGNAGNGVYVYGVGGGFPTNTFQSTDYGVDVVLVFPTEAALA